MQMHDQISFDYFIYYYSFLEDPHHKKCTYRVERSMTDSRREVHMFPTTKGAYTYFITFI